MKLIYSVQIEIVGWDATHCIEEGGFAEMAVFSDPNLVLFERSHDLMYIKRAVAGHHQ